MVNSTLCQISKYRVKYLLSDFFISILKQSIPRYFMLSDAGVNGIISLISLSDLSLLVYRNATNFCILILYPALLPNSLMSYSSFLVVLLGFSMCSIMSSAKSDCFTTSFSIWIKFIYFLCLIALSETYNTMLN